MIYGSNTINQSGTYGTKGVADTNNYPASVAGTLAIKDLSGNIWIFGGGAAGFYNSLWKFGL
jgi:hypothetical protein